MFPGEPKNAKPIVHPIVPDVWPACTHTRNWQYYIYIYRVVYGSFIRRLAIGIRNGYCINILQYVFLPRNCIVDRAPEASTSASFRVRVARGPKSNGSCRSWAAMTRVPWFLVEQLHKIWAFHSPKLGILRVSATMAGDGTNQTEKKTNLAVLDCQCIPNTWTKEQKSIKTWVGNHRNKSQPWKCQACHNPQKARGISSEFLGVSTLQPFTFATPRPPKAAPRKPRGSAKMATVTARSHGIQRRKWLPWMAITCHHQFGGWFSSVGADVLGDSNVLGHMVSNKLGSPSWYLR